MTDAADNIRAFMERHKLTIEAEFVPFSKSRHATPAKGEKEWLSLNWKVTLLRDGRRVLTTDYAQGSGHCPADKLDPKKFGKVVKAEMVRHECETGKRARRVHENGPLFNGPAIALDPVPVLASLASDASAIDYPSYEPWAEDLGFDPDSRKGEAAYRACLEIALALRSAIGDAALSELCNLASDY